MTVLSVIRHLIAVVAAFFIISILAMAMARLTGTDLKDPKERTKP